MIYSITYTDDMKQDTAGYASLWRIYIRPAYKDDKGILEHEKCHVKQFWRTFGLHVFLKAFKWYMKKIEVEAYKEQLNHPPASSNVSYYLDMYAGFISTKYGINISKDEAVRLLS